MPKTAHYTEAERNFTLMLALATKKPWTALGPLIRGLAERGCLSFLGPQANEKFLKWNHQRGYAWEKRYGWDLGGLEEPAPPLPKEEEIDEGLLRRRLTRQELLDTWLKDKTYDPHKLTNALNRLETSIEGQITRRMSRPLTPQTIVDLVLRIVQQFKGQEPDDMAILKAITEEVNRYRYLPAQAS